MQFSLYSEDSSRTYFYNKQICNDAKRKISYESYIEKKGKEQMKAGSKIGAINK